MENDISNSFFSKNFINSYTLKNQKYELTEPNNKSSDYHTLFRNNDYLLKNKNIFEPEQYKYKEDIFKSFKEISKQQIKKEKNLVKKNYNLILKYFSILKNASIDEEIILTKYFEYLRFCDEEEKRQLALKLKNMMIPIKNKEREIKKLKIKIKQYKSFSNQMIMKYMVLNKERFKKYLKEISEKQKNSTPNENTQKNRKINGTTNLTCISERPSNKLKSYLVKNKSRNPSSRPKSSTVKKYNIKNDIMKNKEKIFKPRLYLETEESINNNLNYDYNYTYKYDTFITSYSRTKNRVYKSRPLTAYHRNPYNINKKFDTPQTDRRRSKLFSSKSTGKTNYSSNINNRIKKSNYSGIFNQIKYKDSKSISFE